MFAFTSPPRLHHHHHNILDRPTILCLDHNNRLISSRSSSGRSDDEALRLCAASEYGFSPSFNLVAPAARIAALSRCMPTVVTAELDTPTSTAQLRRIPRLRVRYSS
ncbi:hypothetical protein PMIN03_006528 [Paraphaeosphaeria minitans]